MLYDNYSDNFDKPTKPPKSTTRPKSAGTTRPSRDTMRESTSGDGGNNVKSPKKRSGSPHGSERYTY